MTKSFIKRLCVVFCAKNADSAKNSIPMFQILLADNDMTIEVTASLVTKIKVNKLFGVLIIHSVLKI